MKARSRARIAVAGASGFIGSALCPRLAEIHDVVALTRSPARSRLPDSHGGVHWRHCDLFRLDDVRRALAGVDYAVYLVHSLAPSSRLTQASPRDMDLVLADNFAQAAAANGVRQIVFVSGVMPRSFRFSPLLWSRREVEMVLAAQGVPVTALRASLVVGPGGTGPGLLVDLVRRLPAFLLPPSSRSLTRPIALQDLVRAILLSLGQPQRYQGAFDIGGAEWLSYEAMLRQTAEVLGVRRAFVHVPVMPTRLASLVARVVSGAPGMMVGAVVESLPQDTCMQDNPLQQAIAPQARGFRAALADAVDPQTGRLRPSPRQSVQGQDLELMRRQSLVRSIQRVLLPPGQDAAWVAGNYFRWLGRCLWPLVRTRIGADGSIDVLLATPGLRLLRLRRASEHCTPRREVYRITGGLLARRQADGLPRFEFQTVLEQRYTLTAIHDYAPALPWYLYLPSQAFAHLRVMRWYQRRLARLAR
ncbi:NAD(P)H-binding protein [Thiohalocapsa marina]|uniref:NAD(P)H-binding protein n=1 Tax=Thiohalocapsa marina TaxID=424902 RepID=A0A5M8FVV0_9GAMM|nr:NAD(P)H-binding protein [Thiohalocapsa marina]